MTETEHLEVSRKLALAIGWKPEQMWVLGGTVFLADDSMCLSKPFDYRDPLIAFRVAERFDLFPQNSKAWGGKGWAVFPANKSKGYLKDTPQLAIAIAVISAAQRSEVMTCYLLRKHPRHPFQRGFTDGVAYLEAFTIAGVYKTRAEAMKVAGEKNKRSNYLYTVKRFEGVKP